MRALLCVIDQDDIADTPAHEKVEGIYRVSGLQSNIHAMKDSLNLSPSSAISESNDVHVVTGTLKLFLRELPIPLIPFSLVRMH